MTQREEVDLSRFPPGIEIHERAEMMAVQRDFATVEGVSAIVYIQTCAAEKRRRRKRGTFPDIDKRVFINTEVCEGCGDCGVQSNCVSIVPVETELGRKRAIDQSSCNKDFSCLEGFCPSFVTLEGAKPKKAATAEIELPDLPEPDLPAIRGTYNLLVTGVGGTGVVTVGAILSMAAHLDGRGAAMMEMAGLAQKGGAVQIHCRIAEKPSDISAIRVAVGEADGVIGGDLVVTAGAKTLGLMSQGRTGAVVNSHDIVTGEFTRNTDFRVPSDRLQVSLQARLQDRVAFLDATELARILMGDSIYSNMMVFGAAWQRGLIPLSAEAIQRAIELNGAAVAQNARAFALGRWAVLHPAEADRILLPEPPAPVDPVAYRAERLVGYQSRRLARRFRTLVDSAPPEIREDVARGYYQLLAYKDEYEVARLHLDTMARAKAEFDGDFRPTFHLAPPFLNGKGRGAAQETRVRPLDAACLPPARRAQAAAWHGARSVRPQPRAPARTSPSSRNSEADMAEILPQLRRETMELGRELARLPLSIRGYGPVKEANAATAAHRREALLAAIRAGGAPVPMAAE